MTSLQLSEMIAENVPSFSAAADLLCNWAGDAPDEVFHILLLSDSHLFLVFSTTALETGTITPLSSRCITLFRGTFDELRTLAVTFAVYALMRSQNALPT